MIRVTGGRRIGKAIRLACPCSESSQMVCSRCWRPRLGVGYDNIREVDIAGVANHTRHSKRTANVGHDWARAELANGQARGRAYHAEAASSAVGDRLGHITRVGAGRSNGIDDVAPTAQRRINREVCTPGSSRADCERTKAQNCRASQVIGEDDVRKRNCPAVTNNSTEANRSRIAIAQEDQVRAADLGHRDARGCTDGASRAIGRANCLRQRRSISSARNDGIGERPAQITARLVTAGITNGIARRQSTSTCRWKCGPKSSSCSERNRRAGRVADGHVIQCCIASVGNKSSEIYRGAKRGGKRRTT
jgi:hypothetical protein